MKLSVGWGVTEKCNMKCEFCYSKNVRGNETSEELTFEHWKNFVDQNSEYIAAVNYGTGENSLCKEWYELIGYIRNSYPGIKQSLTTNGTIFKMINEDERLKKIVARSIDEIDVSIDFCNAEKHNKFRGLSNAFDWATNTLDFCANNGIDPTIVFISFDETLETDNLEGIFEIAHKYGSKLRTNIFRPVLGTGGHMNRFIASFDKIVNALYWIEKNHKIVLIQDVLFNSILNGGSFVQSNATQIFDSIRILPNGFITPSTYLITKEYQALSIKEDNIAEKISKSPVFKRVNDSTTPEFCKSTGCEFAESCKGGVIDRRLLWYNTLDERDYYCPYRSGNYMPEKKIRVYSDESFSSVHADYLPTMFFKCSE